MKSKTRKGHMKSRSLLNHPLCKGWKNGMLVLGVAVGMATPLPGSDGLMTSSDFLPMAVSGSGLPAPEWADSPGATQQYFRFMDNSLSGSADFIVNEFGEAAFSVNVGIGQDAWQDPNADIFTRVDNGGAWELDSAGTGDQLSFAIPVQDLSSTGEGFGGSSIDFFITTVIFEPDFGGFYGFPTLSIPDYQIEGLLESSGFVEDHPTGDWSYLSWRGTVHDVTESELTFLIAGGDGIQSLVDSVEAFTVVPEPRTYAVVFGVLALAITVLRRRRR